MYSYIASYIATYSKEPGATVVSPRVPSVLIPGALDDEGAPLADLGHVHSDRVLAQFGLAPRA